MKQAFEIPEGCNRVTIEQCEDKLLTIFETPIKESFMDKIVTINANCTGIEFKEDNPEMRFNDGDIIYVTCSKIFIVKDFEEGSFHAFLDTNYDKIVLDGFLCPKFGGFKCRIASLDEINKIKQSLYKVGKIWNAEKGCIEDIKPKRWRAKENMNYWHLDSQLNASRDTEHGVKWDDMRYISGNYFISDDDAESAAEKIKELLKQINP